MYGLAGERRLTELELDWLPGYENSRPVRIGNAAHQQFQLDVFGEVMDAFYLAAAPVWPPRTTPGTCSRPCSNIWSRSGASRMKASGKCAARGGTSPTPRSWPGSPWTGRSRPWNSSGCTGPSTAGGAPRGDPRQVCRRRIRSERRNTFVQYYGGRGSRRQPADDPPGRLSSAGRSPRARDDRGHPARVDARRLRDALSDPDPDVDGLPQAKGPSSPARSGWPTAWPCWADGTRRSGFSSVSWACGTMSACCPRNTTPRRAASRQFPPGVFPRRPDQYGVQSVSCLATGACAKRKRNGGRTLFELARSGEGCATGERLLSNC